MKYSLHILITPSIHCLSLQKGLELHKCWTVTVRQIHVHVGDGTNSTLTPHPVHVCLHSVWLKKEFYLLHLRSLHLALNTPGPKVVSLSCLHRTPTSSVPCSSQSHTYIVNYTYIAQIMLHDCSLELYELLLLYMYMCNTYIV